MGEHRRGHLLAIAIALASGCGGTTISGDGSGEPASSSGAGAGGAAGTGGAPDAGGASGSATSSATAASAGGAATSDAAYAYCEAGAGFRSFCEPTYQGWGYWTWHVEGMTSSYCEGDVDCNACVCHTACGRVLLRDGTTMFAECPAPASGTAQPECLGAVDSMHACALTCDQGESCPTGMACVDMLEWQRSVCAWVTP